MLAGRPAIQRAASALALGRLQDPDCAPLLGHMIDDDDPRVRRAAVRALGDLVGAEVVPLLLAALRAPWEEVRSDALQAIGRAAPERLPEATSSLRDDPAPSVRRVVAQSLVGLLRSSTDARTRKEVRAQLDRLQLDPDAQVRATAAGAPTELTA